MSPATSSICACNARRRKSKAGYPPRALAAWADRARTWTDGGAPSDLETIASAGAAPPRQPRDVFIYMISGAKVRAPAAAMALIETLK